MDLHQQSEPGQMLGATNAEANNAANLPPEDITDMAEVLPTIKVHKVELHPSTPDVVTRLKGGCFGRFYVEHLKKNPFIRRLVIAIWRNYYPVYANYIVARLSPTTRRWRPLVKLARYVESSNSPSIKVFDTTRVDIPPPKVFPAEDQGYLVQRHNYYEFPPIYVAKISDAEVYGGSNLIFVHDAVIYHDLYDFERDYTSEELHGRHVIDAKKKRMRLIRNDATPEKMPEAASFLDACATNYAHWLTEVLPRIVTFCSLEQYANVPIIVDDGLHRNMMESLALVVGNAREIFTVPIGRSICVDILYVTSVTGYVPFERRNSKLADHSHGIFSPLALGLLKSSVLPFAKKIAHHDRPRKIYLRRTSGTRNLTNRAAIERTLRELGFFAVEPEKLNFLQQVALFNSSKYVIASTGAALANAIFSESGTRVCVMMAKKEGMIYRYWLNMLLPLNIWVDFVLGAIADKHDMGIHADFYVEPKHILQIFGSYTA